MIRNYVLVALNCTIILTRFLLKLPHWNTGSMCNVFCLKFVLILRRVLDFKYRDFMLFVLVFHMSMFLASLHDCYYLRTLFRSLALYDSFNGWYLQVTSYYYMAKDLQFFCYNTTQPFLDFELI